MVWTIKFSRNALKDAKKLRSANLTSNVNQLIEILKQNPYHTKSACQNPLMILI